MMTRERRAWPNGGIPPMTKPVRSFASRAVARRMSGSPATAARRATSTRSGPETQADDGSGSILARGDEHERLHDLPELGPEGGRGLHGRVRRLGEGGHLEGHALALGRVEDALDRRMERWVGHGAESSTRPGPDGSGVASTAMQAIVLADGEVGTVRPSTRAWPGWLEDEAIVIAADGGARHAAALGLSLTEWVGDGDSLGEAGIAELRAAGVPVRQVAAAKDESDTELAVRAALALGEDRVVVLGGLGGAWTTPWPTSGCWPTRPCAMSDGPARTRRPGSR